MKKTIPVVVAVMITLLVTGCNDTSSEQPAQNSTTTTVPAQDDSNFGKPQTRTNPENGQQEHGTGVGGGWQVNPDGSLGYDFGF